MDFLTTALYSTFEGKEKLEGALLTTIDPDSFVSRPCVKFVDEAGLRSGAGLDPRGFSVDSNGTLFADTSCRSVFHQGTMEYIENQVACTTTCRKTGLVDFVLIGADAGVNIIANYDRWADGEDVSPITVSMSSLRVSNSSFNIYAPYQKADGSFRTLSLIDIETDQTIPFIVAIPKAELPRFDKFAEHIEEYEKSEDFEDCVIFRVTVPFRPACAFMGEAYVNFLAYSVSYYRIGERICNSMLRSTKLKDESVPLIREERVPKRPRHNVSIESARSRDYLKEILDTQMGPGALQEFVKEYPDARETVDWLGRLMMPPGTPNNEVWSRFLQTGYTASRHLLHFSAELLVQRFYVQSVGFLDDQLPTVLRGGGVAYESVKRVVE